MSSSLKAAVVVAAALSVMALPGIAAADWNDAGVDITQDITIERTGTFKVSDTLLCKADYSEIIKPGKTGITESIIVENDKGVTNNVDDCKPLGVLAALGCTKVTAFETTGLPWTTHISGSAVTVTGVNFDFGFSGSPFCPKAVNVEGTITQTPDNPNSIHSYTLSGTLNSSLGFKVTVEGLMEVTGGDSGTYGL